VSKKYTILRDAGHFPIADPLERFTRGGGARVTDISAPEPVIETEELSKREVMDLARDSTIAGMAPIMRTKLITPIAAAVGGAQPEPTWGIHAVRAAASTFTGAGVIVAVLDTGIDSAHPAFAGVNVVERDFSGDGNGDRQGHGTHCAGTIFGRDVAGTRIGVARGVTEARIGKVLGDDGSGDTDMMLRGINWAVDQGANVISMSLGFDFPGMVQQLTDEGFPVALATSIALEAYRGNLRLFDALMELIRARRAFGSEVVVIAAAGNESERQVHPNFEIAASLPAAADGVISVGAVEQSQGGFRIADFSNTLPGISAPGVGIVSAKAGGGLVAFNGTSMACPHVAGCAALWWQAVRSTPIPLTATSVTAKLLAQARPHVFNPEVDIPDRGVGLVTAP
jgi:subtilisin family serine protease